MRILIHECLCDERLKTKSEGSTRLAYTGLHGGLEHLNIGHPHQLKKARMMPGQTCRIASSHKSWTEYRDMTLEKSEERVKQEREKLEGEKRTKREHQKEAR